MWVSLGSLSLTVVWQFSPTFSSDFIRVTHIPTSSNYGRGLIGQSNDAGIEFFQVKKLYLKQSERQIFEVIQPVFFPVRTIALKAYVFPTVPWTVNIEYWQSPGISVVIFPASTTQIELVPISVVRKGVAIYNDSTATLYISLGTNVTTLSYDLVIRPSGYYETPFGYKGQIVGVWSAAIGDATVQEFF